MPPDRLDSLPKVELHLHLEGSLRPPTVMRLAEHNSIDIGCATEDELAARYRFRDFLHFLDLFRAGLAVIQSADDYVTIADALVDDLVSQRVRYAEVTTTPVFPLRHRSISAADYAGALDDAQRRAADRGVVLRWILDVARADELPDDHLTADLLTGPHAPTGAVAMGIGGPEVEWPAELFADTFARTRAAGIPAVVHAGEAAGPASVVAALDVLHAARIGHGVRSIEDHTLMQRLVDEQVPLEVSPTSNVLLGVTPPSIEDHPFGALRDAGVNVSVNTDDPGYFSTTLTRELALVCEHHGVDEWGLASLQRAAIDASFAPPELKRAVHTELDDWADDSGGA